MSKATDRPISRRNVLQSAIVLAACGVVRADTPSAPPSKPQSRDCIWIRTAGGEFCCGMVHRPSDAAPSATGKRQGVLILHDLRGSKDEPHRMLVDLADTLAGAGQIVLRFDLLGRGDSEGASIDATPQRDLENARAALAVLQGLPEIDPHDITVLGLSWGGTLAAYVAGDSIAVKRVVLWSSCPVDNPSVALSFDDIDGKPASDQLGCVLSKEFFDALGELTPLTQLRKNRQSILMVYGTRDADIRSDDYETCKSELTFADVNVKAVKIAGANHTFASRDHTKQAIEQTIAWLAQEG